MARQIPSGTPTRSFRMLFPGRDRRLLAYSVAAGAGLLVVIAGLYVLGVRRAVTPGPLARAHHEIEAKCSQCHDEGQNVSDARCGRCHDQAAVGRVEHASHVLLGSGDLAKAAEAEQLACVNCHSDHRGQSHPLRSVDNRECATCHGPQFSAPLGLRPLTSFQNHPEFAAVKAQRTTGVGLQFNHLTHFDYVLREQRRDPKPVPIDAARSSAIATCERCHTRTTGRPEFEPVRFQPGCSGSMCHTDPQGKPLLAGSTGDVSLKYVLRNVPGVLTPPGDGDLQVQGFSGLSHRDPWVQFNAAWLRTALDRAGAAAEREALRASVAWLEQQVNRPILFAGRSVDDLRGLEAALAGRVDAPIPSDGSSEQVGLSRAAADIRDLLARLTGAPAQTGVAPSDDDAALAALAGGVVPPDPDAAGRFKERQAELLRLIAAIRSRGTAAGKADLVQKADALRARVERVAAQPGPTSDLAALRHLLTQLDDVFKLVRQTADPQVQTDLQTLQGLRDYAGGRGIGGLDVPDFDQRRAEIASLLNTLRQSPNAEVREKATALGARLAVLRPAGSTAAALRQQADNRRWLERVRLEIRLQTSREGVTPAPPPVRETEFARGLLEQNRALLATLDAAAGAPPVPDAERKNAGETLNNLLAPCLKCHLFDGEDEGRVTYFPTPPDPAGFVKRDSLTVGERQGLRLAAVGAAEPVMKRAVFSHRPHLTATSCVTCHSSVISGERAVPAIPGGKTVGSTLAIDLNSPGVGTCQSCHKPSGARQDCAVCHVYHPASAERLLRAVWSPN